VQIEIRSVLFIPVAVTTLLAEQAFINSRSRNGNEKKMSFGNIDKQMMEEKVYALVAVTTLVRRTSFY